MIVQRLCLFGFDENHGNCLLASSKVTKKFVITSHTDSELAEICLPDGGHLREHDSVNIIFKTSSDEQLYGYACFRSVRNQQEKRGARQAALLLVSDSPMMEIFRPFLVDALENFLVRFTWGNPELWKNALNHLKWIIEHGFNQPYINQGLLTEDTHEKPFPTLEIEMWGRMYCIRPPSLSPGELGGTYLKDLLKIFREKTMKLWYAIAAERRIMFVGPNTLNASSISNLVCSAPLLVGELAPFLLQNLEPYITLAVVDQRILKRKTFIAGSNNSLFIQKNDWWDLCADISTGTIEESNAPIVDDSETTPTNNAVPTQRSSLRSFRLRKSSRSSSSSSYLATSSSTASNTTSSPVYDVFTHPHYHKSPGGIEMAFVSRILHDLEFQSEAWLRRQFHDFTLSFLNRVGRKGSHAEDLAHALSGLFPGISIIQPRISRFADQFANSGLWKKYRLKQDEIWGGNHSSNFPSNFHQSSPKTPSSPYSQFEEFDYVAAVSAFPNENISHAPFTLEYASGGYRAPIGFISQRPAPVPISIPPSSTLKKKKDQRDQNRRSGNFSTHRQSGKWVKVYHENGEPYYWNVASGETKWENPEEAA